MPTKTRLLAKCRALVAGASRGGAASSLALAQLGCDISISYRHDAQADAGAVSGCRAAADLAALHWLCLAFVPGMKQRFGRAMVITSVLAWEHNAPDLAAATPAGHIATPEDIVGVVAPRAQPGSGWINGTTVLVTGEMNYLMSLVAVRSSAEHDPNEAS